MIWVIVIFVCFEVAGVKFRVFSMCLSVYVCGYVKWDIVLGLVIVYRISEGAFVYGYEVF